MSDVSRPQVYALMRRVDELEASLTSALDRIQVLEEHESNLMAVILSVQQRVDKLQEIVCTELSLTRALKAFEPPQTH